MHSACYGIETKVIPLTLISGNVVEILPFVVVSVDLETPILWSLSFEKVHSQRNDSLTVLLILFYYRKIKI